MNNRFSYTHLLAILLPLSLTLTGCGSSNQTKSPAPIVHPTQNEPVKTVIAAPSKPILIPENQSVPNNKVVDIPAPAIPQTPSTAETTAPLASANSALNEENIKQAQKNLRKVVVLLPDRPSLSEVNRDIEKGIRAAHQLQPHNPHLQIIVLHDALNGEALMQKANAYTPDWIIGPLTKSDIQSIQSLTNDRHIVLNRLDTPTTALQIGLPLEDEIDQLLSQFQPQLGQLLVVASNHASDQRLLTQLNQKAKALAFNVSSVTLEKQNPDLRDWLINEGGIQSSQDRIKRMTNLVRGDFSDSLPQARQDIQALIFLGNAKQLKSIMPSLSYYRINWPIYATSQLLPSKSTDPFNEPELNGVSVLTPPYLINTSGPSSLFEALGWDSYLLLANPLAYSANTQTGKLTNQNNQLRRQLNWMQIQDGRLVNHKQP
ncbi:MAG: penicillin-binding protein activator [Gammaproteobacteria bacterium]|nr:penicillin-binding protein activator [Gammaproteobacteria bacterium]